MRLPAPTVYIALGVLGRMVLLSSRNIDNPPFATMMICSGGVNAATMN
jgi:hypothetical protein